MTHCEPPGSGAAWWFTSLSRPQAQGEGASAEVLTTFAPAPSPLGGKELWTPGHGCSKMTVKEP